MTPRSDKFTSTATASTIKVTRVDTDERVSLAPLSPETALRALLSTKRPGVAEDDQD